MRVSFLSDLTPWEFLKKLFARIQANAVTDRAAMLAYYFLFALFPGLLIAVTLAAYLPVRGAVDDLLARVDQIMPQQAFAIVKDELTDLTTRPRPRLLTLGLLLAIWSSSRGIDAMRGALNLSYDVRESRAFWKTNGISILMTVATAALVLFSFTAFLLGGKAGLWLSAKVGLDASWAILWGFLRWPFVALLIVFVSALLYYFLPDVEQEWRFITPGSVLGSVLWLLATYGFSFYAEHFGTYDKTYGSIGGVIVLLTWLWISALVFLLGGEVNALLEHHAKEGKAKGARAPGEAPAAPLERPSAMPPGAAQSSDVDTAADQQLH